MHDACMELIFTLIIHFEAYEKLAIFRKIAGSPNVPRPWADQMESIASITLQVTYLEPNWYIFNALEQSDCIWWLYKSLPH